jgi:electron transfer flavoprotein alpha subunit
MSRENSVMVFVENNGGKIAEVSLELLCEAGRLAETLKVDVTAVTLGWNLKDSLKKLGHYGCDAVYYIEDKRVEQFSSLPYARAVVQIIRKYDPQIVLFGASLMGRDLAPRVASELKCGLTADCTELQIGEHKIKDKIYQDTLLQIRPAFGGNIIATIVSPESRPSMATVREGVMHLNPPDESRQTEIVMEEILFEEDFLTEIIEIIKKEKSVNLKSSKIIVSAGMGASSSGCIELVRELAAVLGGELGASRPVVDSGALAKERQVGQTGTTVRPNLYIACGISGQVQHRAGMAESKRIIAINNDPDAPIFEFAHYGIVGDVKEVVTRMIKAYKQKT